MLLTLNTLRPGVCARREDSALKIKCMRSKGQISVALILVITVLLGAMGLGADTALLYFNWVLLQKGVDAAALAGAGYLQSDAQAAPQAISVAVTYAQNNGIKNSELQKDGDGNGAYVPGPNYSTITVTAKRTVPYTFFKLIGLSSGNVAATATAQMPLAPSCVNCISAIPTPGSQPTVIPGSICSSVALCNVLPIGLDFSTPYTFNQSVTLNQQGSAGQYGPGNWGSLALGGTGGSNERTNIANGYGGALAINQWVTTEPGFKKGPVDQGFNDRISNGQSNFPSGTFDAHSPIDPRVIILPMVVWNSPNGRSQVEIMAFAALWVDSVSGGTINAHFIDTASFNSTGDPNAPFRGARGRAQLIK
jgi:Flp pilus assembly protein TadG